MCFLQKKSETILNKSKNSIRLIVLVYYLLSLNAYGQETLERKGILEHKNRFKEIILEGKKNDPIFISSEKNAIHVVKNHIKCTGVNVEKNAAFHIEKGASLEVITLSSTILYDDNLIHIHVYPNPFSNVITVKYGEGKNREIHFFNITGQSISLPLIEDSNESVSFDATSLQNGFYLCEFIEGSRKKVFKIIKKNNF